MKKLQFILSTLFLLTFVGKISLFAQDDVCVCCSYSSLQYATDYENIFPHEIIKSKKIKQVIVYTAGHPSADSTKKLFPQYIEMKFKFNSNGYVTSRIHYYLGRPNHEYEFERNALGQITKQTFCYVDSLERKVPLPILTQITDFTYDKNHRLIEQKNRNNKGEIVPENKATYSIYEYDANGNLIKETNQLYFESLSKSTTDKSTTTYTYSNDSLTCVTKVNEKKILAPSMTDTITYDKNGKMLSDKKYFTKQTEVVFDNKYTYDDHGKLMLFEIKTGSLGGSECPDKGTFTDHYFYRADGLVEKIVNSYGVYSCAMEFEYL
jgi:uncharacterized Zn ribbon protein